MGEALTAAFTSSFVGALFSVVLITLFAPILAEIALKFGPPEFFAIQLLTFSSFIGLGGGNPLKSLVSILLGFILASAGLDIVTGQLRLTFGITELMKGFDFIVAVIGLFGIGEILLTMEEGLSFRGREGRASTRRWSGRRGRGCRATTARSSAAPSSASGWASSRAGPRPRRS